MRKEDGGAVQRRLPGDGEDRLHVLAVLWLELRPDLLLGEREEGLLVDVVDNHPLLLKLLQVLGIFIAGEFALQGGDLEQRGFQPAADIRRQTIPPRLARQWRRGPEHMLRQ